MNIQLIEDYIAVKTNSRELPFWIAKACGLRIEMGYYASPRQTGLRKYSDIPEFSRQDISYCEDKISTMAERAETEQFKSVQGYYSGRNTGGLYGDDGDTRPTAGGWVREIVTSENVMLCYWPIEPTNTEMDGGFVLRLSKFNRMPTLSMAISPKGRHMAAKKEKNAPLPQSFFAFFDNAKVGDNEFKQRDWFRVNFAPYPPDNF